MPGYSTIRLYLGGIAKTRISRYPVGHMAKTLTNKTKQREKVAIWLNNEQLKFLRMIQERDGVPVAEQVRRGIDLWLEDKKKQ